MEANEIIKKIVNTLIGIAVLSAISLIPFYFKTIEHNKVQDKEIIDIKKKLEDYDRDKKSFSKAVSDLNTLIGRVSDVKDQQKEYADRLDKAMERIDNLYIRNSK